MRLYTLLWIALGILSVHATVLNHGQHKNGPKQWDYGNTGRGPVFWPHLFAYQCGGLYQSPINIITHDTIYQPTLNELTFNMPSRGSKFVVHNNGNSVQVDTRGDFFMFDGGLKNVYKTEQFHFHWGDNSNYGSEHTIDGLQYPVELHIVNWDARKYNSFDEASKHPGGVAVLALHFEVWIYDNPLLENIIQTIPHVRDPEWNNRIEIPPTSIRNFLPKMAKNYFRYVGSLTTPLCLQSVLWTVYQSKLSISERQLNVFRSVLTPKRQSKSLKGQGRYIYHPGRPGSSVRAREPLVNNFRPVQPLNGRTVYRSFR